MKSYLLIIFLFLTQVLKSQTIKEASNFISSERFDDAYNMLIEIKKNDPRNQYVYFELGETVLKSYINDPYSDTKKNSIKKARTYFNEGIQQDSMNLINYIGLGILELCRNNDSIAADKYFNKALSFMPAKKKKMKEIHIVAYLKLASSELYAAKPRFYKAEGYINKLKELNPDLPDIYITNGDILYTQSKASDAIFNYKKALYLKNEPLTNVMIARIYLLARNLNESRKYFETAIQLDSSFAPAYKGLGDLYYLAGQHKFANDNYSRFLELTGNNIAAKINYIKALYKAKDFATAFDIACELLQVDSSKIFLYRIAAYTGLDKENPELIKALYFINKLFQKAKEDELIPRDYTYYGRILLSLKRDSDDIQKGVEFLEKAYLADTTDMNALDEVIKYSYYNRIYTVQIKYLAYKILKGDSTFNTFMQLGKAYYQNKNYNNADSVFNIALAIDSSSLEANQWMAYALSSGDPDMTKGAAKPYYEKVLQLLNNSQNHKKEIYDALSYLGSYYLFSSTVDLNKAAEYFKQLINIDPENIQWQLKGYYSLAAIYTKQKSWQNSKASYEMILKLKPDDKNSMKALKDIKDIIYMEDFNKKY